MRICYVTEYFPTGTDCDIRGGAEAVAWYEAKYLSEKHEIEVITSLEHGTKKSDTIGKIEVIRCGRPRGYAHRNALADRYSFIRNAFREAIRRKYDLMVGFSIIAYPVAWRISVRLKVPCIIRYHDVLVGRWIRNFGITGIIGELVERYTLSKNFAAIIAVSNYTANNLRRYVRNVERIHVVPNGVEIPLTAHSRERKPIITCVSRLVGYKRIGDLLRAVAVLVKEFPDLQCNIIGTGPEEENLRAMATRLEITQYVSFSGFVKNHDDLMQTISESRLFCLPGSLEGFGIAVLEAMACGVPFVASHIPAIAETTAGKGGLLFECGNVPDMTDKIRILLKDNLLLDRLSEEGLKRAGEFLWKDIAKKTEAIYEKAVAAK